MTRYAEVIGDPIAHSKSPIIHKFWLDALGIEGDYRRTHVLGDDLATYFARAKDDSDWRGCNVTIPHKLAVMDLVGDPGGVRNTIGAMNTVIRGEDGTLIGTNTDAGGFFSPIAGLELEGRHAVVVGAGGGARAVLFALSRVGIGRVTILNRNVLKAAALLSSFGVKGDALPIGAPLPAADLLVNASPLGMDGQPPLDLNLDPLPEHAVVYDIVYAPLETPLLAQARDRELDTVDGLEMLVGQAALAFELFFGAEPPRDRDEELRALLTA
ncbi:shikimate dehydrogenase [Sphingomonas sp. NFR04]|uniref:shikimate dehydrogenase n=1 Tax=Sphingomonas sp. NFR04 TaxID=1566283 RepID=UPI0008EB9337|nr:shikimate dehydrogenase [Sphingomonas sp. NFR04]SFJ85614.1 shikimate dehydrogenase [Sphingomonas sp. NFR04]